MHDKTAVLTATILEHAMVTLTRARYRYLFNVLTALLITRTTFLFSLIPSFKFLLVVILIMSIS